MQAGLSQSQNLTWNTTVSCLEVHGKLSETRSSVQKVAIRYSDVARCFPGALPVGVVQHVGVTANGLVVLFYDGITVCAAVDTFANAHASESGSCHDDDVTMTTSGTEGLQLTVLDNFVYTYDHTRWQI